MFGIYIKDLQILRNTEHNNYEFLETPITTDCLLCSAYSHPTITKDGHLDSTFKAKTLKKMEAMLNIFIENGNTCIILGAWGCGAFGNPAEDIAQMFKSLLLSPTYCDRFEHVVFAVIKDQWHLVPR